jgi:hypothetical protein
LAQQKNHLLAKKTTEAIVVDGVADEAIWQESIAAKDFYQYFPKL